jgi:vacuolar-type H+-ATPase subunit I/STV1
MKNSSENSPKPKWKSWVENTKLLTETFNNIMPIIKIVAGIMGVMLLVVFIQGQFKGSDDIDRYIADARRFQEEAQVAVAFADSLKGEVELREIAATDAIARATQLSQQVSSLRSETRELRDRAVFAIQSAPPTSEMNRDELITYVDEIVPLQQQIIDQQETTINMQTQQIGELETALVFKDETIALLTQSNDSLQFVLRNPPVPPSNPNKMFGITLPSRTTSFIAGAITATVAIVVLSK